MSIGLANATRCGAVSDRQSWEASVLRRRCLLVSTTKPASPFQARSPASRCSPGTAAASAAHQSGLPRSGPALVGKHPRPPSTGSRRGARCARLHEAVFAEVIDVQLRRASATRLGRLSPGPLQPCLRVAGEGRVGHGYLAFNADHPLREPPRGSGASTALAILTVASAPRRRRPDSSRGALRPVSSRRAPCVQRRVDNRCAPQGGACAGALRGSVTVSRRSAGGRSPSTQRPGRAPAWSAPDGHAPQRARRQSPAYLGAAGARRPSRSQKAAASSASKRVTMAHGDLLAPATLARGARDVTIHATDPEGASPATNLEHASTSRWHEARASSARSTKRRPGNPALSDSRDTYVAGT